MNSSTWLFVKLCLGFTSFTSAWDRSLEKTQPGEKVISPLSGANRESGLVFFCFPAFAPPPLYSLHATFQFLFLASYSFYKIIDFPAFRKTFFPKHISAIYSSMQLEANGNLYTITSLPLAFY